MTQRTHPDLPLPSIPSLNLLDYHPNPTVTRGGWGFNHVTTDHTRSSLWPRGGITGRERPPRCQGSSTRIGTYYLSIHHPAAFPQVGNAATGTNIVESRQGKNLQRHRGLRREHIYVWFSPKERRGNTEDTLNPHESSAVPKCRRRSKSLRIITKSLTNPLAMESMFLVDPWMHSPGFATRRFLLHIRINGEPVSVITVIHLSRINVRKALYGMFGPRVR